MFVFVFRGVGGVSVGYVGGVQCVIVLLIELKLDWIDNEEKLDIVQVLSCMFCLYMLLLH